jgi:hypothetical protein
MSLYSRLWYLFSIFVDFVWCCSATSFVCMYIVSSLVFYSVWILEPYFNYPFRILSSFLFMIHFFASYTILYNNEYLLKKRFLYCCIEYTSPWAGFELTTLVMIDTDCKSNYILLISDENILSTRTSRKQQQHMYLIIYLWFIVWHTLLKPLQKVNYKLKSLLTFQKW